MLYPRTRVPAHGTNPLTGDRPADARLLNVVAPGCGLVWLGDLPAGLAAWLLFLAGANLAVYGALHAPLDVPLWLRGVALGVALGAYLAAQWRFAQQVRDGETDRLAIRRRTALQEQRAAIQRGDAEAAWQALGPILELAEVDLLVAVRVAETLTARGDAEAAAAWRRVRRLDRHRLYSGPRAAV